MAGLLEQRTTTGPLSASAPGIEPWSPPTPTRMRRARPDRPWLDQLIRQLGQGGGAAPDAPTIGWLRAPAVSPTRVVQVYAPGVLATRRRFTQLGEDVARLVGHPDGTYDPIERAAAALARHVLALLRAVGSPPTRVVPLADGGLSFQFRGSSATRYGALTVDNDGDMVAIEIDSTDSANGQSWLVAPEAVVKAAERLQDFASR